MGSQVILGLALIGSLLGWRNQLQKEREAIEVAWSYFQPVFLHRAEVIVRVVETLRRSTDREEPRIDAVSSSLATFRRAKTREEGMAADRQIESSVPLLLIAVENYPNLKADQDYMRLQDELSGVENRHAVERVKYNEAVKKYNRDLENLGKNIASIMFGFAPEDLYFRALR